MSRVAAIDCGTNSIRLLIADINGDNSIQKRLSAHLRQLESMQKSLQVKA